jgi:hypothetical protein
MPFDGQGVLKVTGRRNNFGYANIYAKDITVQYIVLNFRMTGSQ